MTITKNSMNQDILRDLLPRIKNDFDFKESGDRYIQGKCPHCNKKELYTFKLSPWVLKCGRLNNCGAEIIVKEEYPDLFDDWSKRYVPTEQSPNAAADAYLMTARGLKISELNGAYTQELFKDYKKNITSATVRFPLPNGSWWERIIDQPSRFDRKAHFKPKNQDGSGGYGGFWWSHPKVTIETLAKANEIWIAEGIFDAIALHQAGKIAVSAMSVGNYCEHSLAEITNYLAKNKIPTRPRLIFAYDIGKAGSDATKKHIDRAKTEGWHCAAAQPAGDDQSKKSDWNDLYLAGKLGNEFWAHYLWLGDILLAESPKRKAELLGHKITGNNFDFTFENRTYWAKIDNKVFEDAKKEENLSDKKAREVATSVTEIMQGTIRFLYFQRDTTVDETAYYIEVKNSRGFAIADKFTGSQIAAAGDFKKRLLSVGAGVQWVGTTPQLERIVARGTQNIKIVHTLDFTGYSRDHNAYILGDYAVAGGRVYKMNNENYFDIGKNSLKLRSVERMLKNEFDADKFDISWQYDFWNAFRANGIVALSFWIMSLFAEQIRGKHGSLPFLEITGEAGSGKSYLIEFLWKLFGRDNYEGFDPTKATAAAIARNLGRAGNLPVVLLEGDRDKEVAHSKKFEWDELKTAYNGRSVRSRGVKNSGNETYEPPFRGALVIVQNYQVDASPALMERIMAISINKEKWWNNSSKISSDEILGYDIDKISGHIIHFLKQEKSWLETFFAEFEDWESHFFQINPMVKNQRIRKNHAQLHAAIDACFRGEKPLLKWRPDQISAAHDLVDKMAQTRDESLQDDHPIVAEFWEAFDYIEYKQNIVGGDPELIPNNAERGINLHRDGDKIAVNLNEFADLARKYNQTHAPISTLKKYLGGSKSRKFICLGSVNPREGKTAHAWIFWKAGIKPPKEN